MRTASLAPICALLGVTALACGRPDSADAPADSPAAVAVAPDPALPEGTLASISLEPKSFFAGVGELVEAPVVRALAPSTTGALLRALTGLPAAIEARVPARAPLGGLVLEDEGDATAVFVVRLEPAVEGVAPLGGGVEARPGAPSGGLFVRDPRAAEQPEMALVGDLLFVSERRGAIERAHRHLAHRLGQPFAAALRVDLEAPALARHLRPLVERGARDAAARAEARVRELRDATGRAPELGDPEHAIHAMRDHALDLASLMPDVESGHAELVFEGGLARFTLTLTAASGSPLFARLEKLAPPEGGLAELMRELPASAALAFGSARGGTFAGWLEVLGEGRLSEGDRARLEGLFPDVPTALTYGGDHSGGYVRVSRASEADASWTSDALAIPHLRTLLAALVGCEASKKAPRADPRGGATLCREGDAESRLAVKRAQPSSLTLSTTARAGGASEAASEAALGADAARALGTLDDRAAMAVYLEASRVIPALALRARFLELRALTTELPPRPVVGALRVEGRDAELRLALTRGSIDRFVALFAEASRLLVGP